MCKERSVSAERMPFDPAIGVIGVNRMATGGRPKRCVDIGESELQAIIEKDLQDLEGGLRLVGSYLPVGSGVLDILAVDAGLSPVVIELKAQEGADGSALLQALSYAAWVDDHPEAIVRYAHQRQPGLFGEELPEPCRIILVAPSYEERTILAASKVDPGLDVRLLRWLCFELAPQGRWLHFDEIEGARGRRKKGTVPREYRIDEHFEGGYEGMRPLFDALRKVVEEFAGVEVYPKQDYIGFRRRRVFAVVKVQERRLLLLLHLERPSEPPINEDPEAGGWSWVTHSISLSKPSDIDERVISALRASHEWSK